MRTRTGILITIGALFGAMVLFLLLFWFAFPRWWPEVVIKYSPSLKHVLTANAKKLVFEAQTPQQGLFTFFKVDLDRFEVTCGDGIFDTVVDCDDGTDPELRFAITYYLGSHRGNPMADAAAKRLMPLASGK
jgi:hypothetical protein